MAKIAILIKLKENIKMQSQGAFASGEENIRGVGRKGFLTIVLRRTGNILFPQFLQLK